MVAFSRNSNAEVAEKVKKLRSLQSIAMEKFDPEFSLMRYDQNPYPNLITTDLDVEFVIRGKNFFISCHTLILGKHYLMGPTINYVHVTEETDFEFLSEQLNRIDAIRALNWSNWLCTSLGIPRLIESSFTTVELSLENKVENMAEMMSVLARSIGILKTLTGPAPFYAETLVSDFDRYVSKQRNAREPKFVGYNPFYDLRILGREQLRLRQNDCLLGCKIDDIPWNHLLIT